MNQTKLPSINTAVAGFVFQEQDPGHSSNVDQKALETASVDLISKLENLLAKSHDMDHDDFIDESGEIAGKMIESLTTFSNEFLNGSAADQVAEETERATAFVHTYEEVLTTRPLTNAILRAFWKVEESKDILTSHAELGESLVRACATTFYHTVMLIGMDNEFGIEIDKSTVVFVNQLQEYWK